MQTKCSREDTPGYRGSSVCLIQNNSFNLYTVGKINPSDWRAIELLLVSTNLLFNDVTTRISYKGQ